MINTIKPDIFGVQEAYRMQVDYIVENCPDYGYYGVGREDGLDGGEHMAIFYHKNVFALRDSMTFWLSETPDVPSFGWDAACKRTATVALLEHKPTGKMIYYVNTHLDHVGKIARREGLNLIVSKIDSLNSEGYPMVLTGDFNVVPSDPCLKALDGKLLNARETALQTDASGSFNGWKPLPEVAGQADLSEAALGNDLKTAQEALAIDYIFYSGFSSCPQFETVTTTFEDIPFISDHYPVKAVLVF